MKVELEEIKVLVRAEIIENLHNYAMEVVCGNAGKSAWYKNKADGMEDVLRKIENKFEK